MNELEQAYEDLNQANDLLGDVLAYLEGDPNYTNAKPALIDWIKSYFQAKAPRSHGQSGDDKNV